MTASPDSRPRYAKSGVPEGRCGDWAVERFEIGRSADVAPGRDSRPVWARAEPGTYTRLRRGAVDFMTDLYEEWWSQRVAMEEAWRRGGDVLVTGLGLGLLAEAVLAPDPSPVRSLTVVELSRQVIELVGPYLGGRYPSRLSIVGGDAFEWTPPAGARYSVVWHDIWPSPFDPRSVAESRLLMARYAPYAEWQGSWALEYRALAGVG